MSSLPPDPRSAALQTVAFAHDPFGTLQQHARRYGDPCTLKLFTGPIVLTGTPEGIQELFTAPPQIFTSNSISFLAPLTGVADVPWHTPRRSEFPRHTLPIPWFAPLVRHAIGRDERIRYRRGRRFPCAHRPDVDVRYAHVIDP
jgi:hypothetical protein